MAGFDIGGVACVDARLFAVNRSMKVLSNGDG